MNGKKMVSNSKRLGVVTAGTVAGGILGYFGGGLLARAIGLPLGGGATAALGLASVAALAPGNGGHGDLFALGTGAGVVGSGLMLLSAGLGLGQASQAAAQAAAPVAGFLSAWDDSSRGSSYGRSSNDFSAALEGLRSWP